MFIFLHEVLLKVPTPFIWSLKPYGLRVPGSMIQCSSLILHREVFEADLSELYTFQGFALSCHPQNGLVDGNVCGEGFDLLFKLLIYGHSSLTLMTLQFHQHERDHNEHNVYID